MSKPPREFVPRTRTGRVVLFIASLGAVLVGSVYIFAWSANWRRYSDKEALRPWLLCALCLPVAHLLVGTLGLFWAVATPRWIAGQPSRFIAHVALYLWVITAVVIAAVYIVQDLYPSSFG